MCNAKPRRRDGHATPNHTGVTRGDAKAGEQLRELQGRGWAPNMVSLLFLKYDTNYYSTAGCRLSGEGFRLSIAFMSIFDAKGGALPFVFDATWMGKSLRWHLISTQRGWETGSVAVRFRCDWEGGTPLRGISGRFRHNGEGFPSLLLFRLFFADCLPF